MYAFIARGSIFTPTLYVNRRDGKSGQGPAPVGSASLRPSPEVRFSDANPLPQGGISAETVSNASALVKDGPFFAAE
jgi:hypothetical protein